jgi:Tol biopolymer transport system component
MIDSNGGKPRRLTTRGGEDPVWSPDGRLIAFLRSRGEAAYFYALNPRGGPARRVYDSNVAGIDYGSTNTNISPPEWQPLPR